MSSTVFPEMRFWLLVVFSIVLPLCIYGVLLKKRASSRTFVLTFGFLLVVIAGIDVYLLQSLAALAKQTPSLADDTIFISEVSLALYLLPAMFGGVGINIISHILVSHLVDAEKQYDKEHVDGKQRDSAPTDLS